MDEKQILRRERQRRERQERERRYREKAQSLYGACDFVQRLIDSVKNEIGIIKEKGNTYKDCNARHFFGNDMAGSYNQVVRCGVLDYFSENRQPQLLERLQEAKDLLATYETEVSKCEVKPDEAAKTIFAKIERCIGLCVAEDVEREQPQGGSVEAFTLPVELNSNKAQILFRDAIEAGLMSKTDSGYKWNKSKALCAYFAYHASEYLKLGKGEYDGKAKISWKPFESLFNIKGLSRARNDYQKTGLLPKCTDIVDSLFE